MGLCGGQHLHFRRDGSGSHVGPLYWETVQSAAALVSPAGLLSPNDARVQGYLDVLEDRLLLENTYVGGRDWFAAGWQYQGGLERTANMHLAGDDIPCFLRSFLNCYAIDILPSQGYVFNEHADKVGLGKLHALASAPRRRGCSGCGGCWTSRKR